MVVVLKTPNPLLQNLFHYDVDLLVVSCDSMPWSGCPLRFGELVVDARCELLVLEPYIFLLEKK
jgi:hypothetical protein